MSSESDILKVFGEMTLDDTSSSSSGGKKKKKKKKEEAVRMKLCGVKKKTTKKKRSGLEEELRKAHFVNMFNTREGKLPGTYKIPYGVERSVSGKLFFAQITKPDGHLVCLGTFKSPNRAARAYDQAAFQIYGLQAPLNFPPPPGTNNNI